MKKVQRKRKHFGMFEFPAQVTSDGVCVNIYDEFGCSVRNYTGIISYSPSLIILDTPIGRLMITGKDMILIDSDSREIKITGCVKSADFSGEA